MFQDVRPHRIADVTFNMEAEVTEMIAMPIPPMEPFVSGGGGSVWAGIIAAAILVVVLATSAWLYLRNRNVDADQTHDEAELPKAA